MKLIIDSANAEGVKKASKILNIWGVTTNPSIIVKEHKDFDTVIKELCEVMTEDQTLFVQTVSLDLKGMLEEARYIHGLRKNIVVKIPTNEVGLQAIKELKKEGITTLGTTIFNSMQGLMAALNGARYLAPYVNKMSNYTDGIQEAINLQKMCTINNLDAEVVVASLKNTTQIKELFLGGIHAATVPLDLIFKLYESPLVDDALQGFNDDWFRQYGRTTLRQ